MTKPPKYKPAGGVEYAFSPELVESMYDREDDIDLPENQLDLSGLRPAHAVERVNTVESRRGKYVFTTTTTHTIISNRPINTTTNTGETQS